MGKAISMDEVPAVVRGSKASPLRDEIQAWYDSEASDAYELISYDNTNTARTCVSKMNAWMTAQDINARATSRGNTVYVVRDKPVAPKPVRKPRRSR
jgi:hypothetical protein